LQSPEADHAILLTITDEGCSDIVAYLAVLVLEETWNAEAPIHQGSLAMMWVPTVGRDRDRQAYANSSPTPSWLTVAL